MDKNLLCPAIIILLLISGIAYALQQKPSWLNKTPADQQYFYAVGYAEDSDSLESVKNESFAAAKAIIANYIFEDTSVKQVFESKGNLSSGGELIKNYDETVKSSSSVRLAGAAVSDFYSETTNDSGLRIFKVWVLAKILKSDLTSERNRIIGELQRKLSIVDDNLKNADICILTMAILRTPSTLI